MNNPGSTRSLEYVIEDVFNKHESTKSLGNVIEDVLNKAESTNSLGNIKDLFNKPEYEVPWKREKSFQ